MILFNLFESEVRAMAFEYLEQYSSFDSVEEMDQHVEQHISTHYFDLTESERAIVFSLSQRSLMYPGASHLKAETIAETVGVSTKTVYRAIKKLVQLNIIEKVPGTKMNGIKGASIYMILPFNVPTEMSERENVEEVNNDKVLETKSENQSFNSFNLSKTSSLQEIYNNAHEEKEAAKEWMNEYQVMLFDFMDSLPLVDQLKDELHKVVLASQVDNVKDFITAKNVIFKIAMDLKDGVLTISRTLRSVFAGAYSKALERKQSININPVGETPKCERKISFYDWLNERERGLEFTDSKSNLENWLEW